MKAHHLRSRARDHAHAIFELTPGPLPVSAMLRSGGAVGAGFVLFLLFDRPEAAVLCAFLTNFLCLCDRASHVVTRVWVQGLGAALFALAGGVGLLETGHPAVILATVLVTAIGAGLVHGTAPGVEAVPRFALCCLVVTAFLPIDAADGLAAVLLGAALSVTSVLLDDYARNGRRGPYMARVRAGVRYPGPRFSLVYGCAAACGLGVGLVWGGARPYWVTLTTLLVMQPDRRANTVRVLQRFLGTLAGVVVAFAIVLGLPAPMRDIGLRVLILALPFVWPLGFNRNYALGVAVLSAWVLLVLDVALPNTAVPLFATRLTDTAIGCAVALVGSFAIFELPDAPEEG